jgi:pSer/pThr/pTyr-binding forkhead associated (FHA) protein
MPRVLGQEATTVSKLVVRSGTEPGKEFGLPDAGDVKIGRMPGVGITLLDAKVSREHCRLFLQSTGWIVEDLASRNGTYVNAQRVKKRLLQPGDRLRVGQTEFEFSKAPAGASPPPAAQGSPTADLPPAAPAAPAAGSAPAPLFRPTKKPAR